MTVWTGAAIWCGSPQTRSIRPSCSRLPVRERRTSYSGWAAPAMTTVGTTGSIMTVISGRKSSMRMQNTPLTGWTMSPASMTMPQGWTRPGYVCSGSAAAGSGCGTMCRTTSSRWQAFIPGRLGISVNMSEI